MGTDTQAESPESQFETHNRLEHKWLFTIILCSFVFALVSIPMYRLVCKKIDPGGSAAQNGTIDIYDGNVDTSRKIRVRFTTAVNRELPWAFESVEGAVEVHPGQKTQVNFWAKNLDPNGEMTGKGVYDINPPEAGQYFKKVECFCFREQTLGPGERAELPVVFWFEESIPKEIKNVTVAYTFFNMETSLKRSMRNREKKKQ